MNDEAVRETVVRLLGEIAPELDPAELKPAVNLRDQLDLDSMDFLNFVIAMHKEFGVDIPEADYRKLVTLDACMAYLQAALRAKAA